MWDGCPECDCYLKSGFQSGPPPQPPARPEWIDGFRFEEGKCMPMSGRGYMESRWEVPGNYFEHGIDYYDCAERCRNRKDCVAWDVWY